MQLFPRLCRIAPGGAPAPGSRRYFRDASSAGQAQLRDTIDCGCTALFAADRQSGAWNGTGGDFFPAPNTTLGPFAAFDHGACTVADSGGAVLYTRGTDYTLHDAPGAGFNASACAGLCEVDGNCTGFEHPADESYCWLWLNGACTGRHRAGFQAAESSPYTTYFLPELGSPAGLDYSLLLQAMPATSPLVSALLAVYQIDEIRNLMESTEPLNVHRFKNIICGAAPVHPVNATSDDAGHVIETTGADDPGTRDVAKDPFRSRIIELGALFAGAEVKYAPATFQSVRNVIVRANTTFDKLATVFRAVDCYRRRSYAALATSGDEGLLIDRCTANSAFHFIYFCVWTASRAFFSPAPRANAPSGILRTVPTCIGC